MSDLNYSGYDLSTRFDASELLEADDLQTAENLLSELPMAEAAEALASFSVPQLCQVYEHVTGGEADDGTNYLIAEITSALCQPDD